MNRNLDGIYFRVSRDGKWQNICLSDMNSSERKECLARYSKPELLRVIDILCDTLHYDIGDTLDLVGA